MQSNNTWKIIMLDYEALKPIVENNARIVKMGYPQFNGSDISQEMWMWIYGNQGAVADYLKVPVDGPRLIGFRLRSIGHRWAAKENAFLNGVDYEDQHVYTVPALRLLLSDVFDHDDWQSHQVVYDDMPKAKAQTNMTGDRIAMLADVSSALSRVEEDHYNILVWVFKYKWSYEELGDYLDGISPDAARKRTDRAIGRVRALLMGIEKDTDKPDPEYIGSRRAVSNSTAMSYQSNMWNG